MGSLPTGIEVAITVCTGQALEEQVDRAIALERAVQTAEQFDRAMLRLFLDGHSQSDIAAIVGTTESNVSTRVHRLKAWLGTHFLEGEQ
jgi:DNA-directed RNA polymerase specialized sigma24 family protein